MIIVESTSRFSTLNNELAAYDCGEA